MTPRVDCSREACEQAAKTLGSVAEYALTPGQADKITDAADLILALRAALDAAERERDALLACMSAQIGLAEDAGYARGVRDAAALVKLVRDWDGAESYCDSCHNGQANPDKDEVATAILALLSADAAAEKKETGDGNV